MHSFKFLGAAFVSFLCLTSATSPERHTFGRRHSMPTIAIPTTTIPVRLQIRATPSSSSTTDPIIAPASTTTVAAGATANVGAGTVVVGGAGGGVFSVNGVFSPVAEGETTTAKDEPSDFRSTASTTPSLIFPNDGTSGPGQISFVALLNEVLGAENYVLTNATDLGMSFAFASLTVDQTTRLSGDPQIKGVEPDVRFSDNGDQVSGQTKRRDLFAQRVQRQGNEAEAQGPTKSSKVKRALVEQTNAKTELRVISQPSGTPLDKLTSYKYDSSSGVDVTVYVIDSGFATNNPEYTKMGGQPPRWLFGGQQKVEQKKEDIDADGHGSCVASKVNGPSFGIVKSANLVVVKVGESGRDILDGIAEVIKDVKANNLNGKAIVNFSNSIPADKVSTLTRLTLDGYVAELCDLDVVFVTAAGNDFVSQKAGTKPRDVDSYPGLWESKYPIIVVGGVDNQGVNGTYSQGGPNVTVMAPGDVTCASKNRIFKTQQDQGTSVAAPAVAGLAAYLLAVGEYPQLYSPGQVAQNMKDLIKSLAYSRQPTGAPVIWNGVGGSNPACKRKRQDDGSCTAPEEPLTAPPNFSLAWAEDATSDPGKVQCNSFNYYETTASYTDSAFTDDPETWCSGRCSGDESCKSVFLTKLIQTDLTYFICNKYNGVFDNGNLQCTLGTSYVQAAAFNKS